MAGDNTTDGSGIAVSDSSLADKSTMAGNGIAIEDIITGFASGPLEVPIWPKIRQNIAPGLTARNEELPAP